MAEQVVDASLAIKWVVKGEPFRAQAQRLLYDDTHQDITLIGPHILIYEVETIIQRQVYHGRITTATADASLTAFYKIVVQIVDHPLLVERARQLARRFKQERIYDSLYCALADLRGCEFWTADRAFYEAVRRQLSYVKYLPDYTQTPQT